MLIEGNLVYSNEKYVLMHILDTNHANMNNIVYDNL